MAESAGMQANGKYYLVVKNLYSVDGTDQDWFRMAEGTTAYLIEGSLHNPSGAKRLEAPAAIIRALSTFMSVTHPVSICISPGAFISIIDLESVSSLVHYKIRIKHIKLSIYLYFCPGMDICTRDISRDLISFKA